MLALQLALPYRTPLPADSNLAPRRPRPVAETPIPTYSALMTAPIFAPDRAPGGTSSAKTGPVATIDQLVVAGIAISRGASSAIIKTTDGHSQVLKPGQDIAGWRLVGIDATHCIFVRGGERRILTLDPRKAAGIASAPAAQAKQNDDEDDQ